MGVVMRMSEFFLDPPLTDGMRSSDMLIKGGFANDNLYYVARNQS